MKLLGVHRLHYRKGGAEGVFLDHQALYRAKGWDCAEFAMQHPDNEPSEWSRYFPSSFAPKPGVLGALAATPRFLHSAEAREKFAGLLDDFRPDVIHAHGIYHYLTSAIIAPAVERRIPIVYTLHDYKLICPVYHFYTERLGSCEKCKGGRQWNALLNRCTEGSLAQDALYALDGWLEWRRGTIRNAVSAFVGPSRFIAEKFIEHGFDPATMHVVPNFFQSTADEPVDRDEVAAIKAREGRHALYFGRLSSEKGVHVLIEAAARANVPIVLVGDGPRRADLEKLARDRGVKAHFTGYKQGAALWAHVEAADVVVLPSVCYEIAPKSLLEAQARCKTVIASRAGGMPEMIEDGVTGHLVRAGDPDELARRLTQVFATPAAELDALGRRAREHALTAFTTQRYEREMTAIYEAVLGGSARR